MRISPVDPSVVTDVAKFILWVCTQCPIRVTGRSLFCTQHSMGRVREHGLITAGSIFGVRIPETSLLCLSCVQS